MTTTVVVSCCSKVVKIATSSDHKAGANVSQFGYFLGFVESLLCFGELGC